MLDSETISFVRGKRAQEVILNVGLSEFTAFWIRPPLIPWSGWFKRVWAGAIVATGSGFPLGEVLFVFQWPYYELLFAVNAMEARLEGWNRDEGHVDYICFRLENLIAYRAD